MAGQEKKVVVLQSNYLPWKGYFDLISRADVFIFYDDVQFTKNDWRNRNKIKTPRGPEWISIPCGTNLRRLILEVEIEKPDWQKDHWNRICLNYEAAPFFEEYRPYFEAFFLGKAWKNLSELNQYLIKGISRDFLKLKTQFESSVDYHPEGVRLERLLDVLKKSGATEYFSGPSAKAYIDEQAFRDAGIKISWMDYGHYPEYLQRYPPFTHEVSIIDLLFNEGPESIRYIRPDKSEKE